MKMTEAMQDREILRVMTELNAALIALNSGVNRADFLSTVRDSAIDLIDAVENIEDGRC